MLGYKALVGTVLVVGGTAFGFAVSAAELPKATQKILAGLKLDASVLKGLDAELKVPAGWIEKARKAGEVKIYGTMDHEQFEGATAPFRERYPFIKLTYSRPKRNDRAMKPLIALKTGRYITDVVTGLGGKFYIYKKNNLLADLRDLPNYNRVIKGANDPDGSWVGTRTRIWCMAYNTKKVKKADLPKAWGDLLTMKRWRNKKIGMANRPNQVILPLWGVHGEAWGRNFIDKLFTVVKPQLRKEGTNALVSLAIAGEFDASFPAAMHRVHDKVVVGAPVNFHCPAPVPTTITEVIILKGSPRIHAAKLLVNWMISKEYQLAQNLSAGAASTHRDLQGPRFLKFADQIAGRKRAFRGPGLARELPKIYKIWNPLWEGGLGLTYRTIKTKVLKSKRGGRRVYFMAGGKQHKVKVSGSRTKIVIKGAEGNRSDVKAGMTCAITYPGNNEEARKIACD